MPTHHCRLNGSRQSRARNAVGWLVATMLLYVAACTPDRATAPGTGPRQPATVSTEVAAGDAEQLLFQQPPVTGTNLYTGECCDQLAAADFVVPAGGNWRTSRFVIVGYGPPSPPGVGDFQVNVFRDDGTGRPGDIIVSGISPVPDGVPNPCCAGDVFDYSRRMELDLPPGRYWVTSRFELWPPNRFRPQLAPAIGYPGLVGRLGIDPFVPIAVAPPNNDFAFSVYGTVETAAEAAVDLLTTIDGFALADGTANSLIVKLTAAHAALDAGDTAAACHALQDLINATSAQSGKKLTEAQATAIIDEATRIRGIIGC
jgi:hypothetical protein